MNGKKAKAIARMVWQGSHGVTRDMTQYKLKEVYTHVAFCRNISTGVVVAASIVRELPLRSTKRGDSSQQDYEPIFVTQPVVCDEFHRMYRKWKRMVTRHVV